MKVFVTKYALTSGIYTVEVDHEEGSRYVYWYPRGRNSLGQQFVLGRDAFVNAIDAIDRIERMIKTRKVTLQRSIEILDRMLPHVMVRNAPAK